MKKPVHSSWRIALLCVGISLGVFAAPYLGAMFVHTAWGLVAIILGGLGMWQGRVYMLPCLLLAGVLLGLWRSSLALAELAPYANLTGHIAVVEGVVEEDPAIDKKHMMILRLQVRTIAGHTIPGKLWVTTKPTAQLKRGMEVAVKGKITEGFGTYAASIYRAEVVAAKRSNDIGGTVRDWFAAQVKQVVPDPEVGLGIGFLTGQNQTLPPELLDAMKTAGLTHIVVASGYNLTILVRLARRVFVRISKYLAALSASLMIGGFMTVTGLSPSMSRAGLVAGLSLAAWYYGRKFHPLVLLPFAAAVTLLINPAYGWGDIGWQLSFAAFAGVMVLSPLLQAYFFGAKKPGIVRQIAGETIAAQLATLPILVVAFGQFSNVALFANLLVVPLVPAAMLVTFLAGMTAGALPPIAGLLGSLAQLILGYMVSVTNFFAQLPWALAEVTLPWYGAAIIYGLLAGLCGYLWWATRYDMRTANLVE